MSQASLEEFGAIGQPSWLASCAAAFMARNITTGLVDWNGNPVNVLNNATGGITVQACYEVCGPDHMYQLFSYTTFSSSFTSWLLPWLALTAQLPYETAGPRSDIMSGLLAVGSPALITYSLSLTIMNRFWVRRRFANLKKQSRMVPEHAAYIGDRIRAAADLLQDAQHGPLRVSQEDGWLSSLIVLRKNQTFWEIVKKDLGNTRRGFTASLLAQMLMAAIAFLFTVISSFIGDVGDKVVALQIASGSIWIWMIPVILGWILVSTQSRAGAINDALQNTHHQTYRALEPGVLGELSDDKLLERGMQCGITSRSGLNPILKKCGSPVSRDGHQPHGARKPSYALIEENHPLSVPPWLGFDVSGDDKEEGPIYNYSHVFTWFQCAMKIEKGFASMLEKLRRKTSDRKQVNGEQWPSGGASSEKDPLSGTSEQVADYCDLPLSGIDAYIPWSKLHTRVWHHIFFAAAVATLVQWGTTGPGILIAYLTPTEGLGCRSGSYLLYGSAATSSWLLLVFSSLFSHAAMLRHQALRSSGADGDTRKLGHSIICGLAVCTRILGKAIAVANAAWLLVFTLLEYTGAFENCWCDANVLGMGNHGWASVFMTASDISSVASGYWAGGLAFSLLVCIFSLMFFWLGSGDALYGDE